MFRRSGYRFADKNMRQRKGCSHFRRTPEMTVSPNGRKWL
jgi:hypothetical protein